MKKHIYLTGFMGAGKSRVGRTFARQWNWPFYDTDSIIEKESAKSVKEIFETDGEDLFRLLEKEVIKKLASETYPAIISLGGGALMDPENFNLIRETGLLIYIKSAPEFLFERVHHTDKRPLLKTDRDENFDKNLLTKIKNLLELREPVYQQADIVFERDGLKAEAIYRQLDESIRKKWDAEYETD